MYNKISIKGGGRKMDIKMGTVLTLEKIDADVSEKYSCRVVDFEEGALLIDYPIHTVTKRTSFLTTGETLRVSFVDDSKVAHAFQTKVVGRKKSNIPMLLLTMPEDDAVQKIQRREYVRVETPIDVSLRFENNFYQFVTADVSAGGISIFLNRSLALKPGDEVELTLVFPFQKEDEPTQYVHTVGQIIRLIERDGQVIVPIQFHDVDELERKIITRFCFERQLMQRQKERI